MIRRLDAITIGQIAAGEVIERPVSVVKELVENALDAGATRVTVALRDGGYASIEVRDDGHGIAPAELPLAVERHATSKLSDARGLEALATLGFRGEGLASVAAVARVTITSRRREDEFASRVEAFEDRVSDIVAAAGPVGTSVIAAGLFENVPVRREYLRSPQAETTRISQFLTTLSLGYPQTAFSLRIDDRESFSLPPASTALDRLAHVFGRDVYERMMPIEEIDTGMHGTIRGFVSKPGADRGDRRMQLLFVNGRLLRSTQLSGAWSGGYTGYVTTGRYPFGVLMLDLPPDHVDPNVHPTKSDVRFRFATQLTSAVRRAIVTTLHRDAARRLGDAVSLGPAPSRRDAVAQIETLFVPDGARGDHPNVHEHGFDASPSWQNARRLAGSATSESIALFAPTLRYADEPANGESSGGAASLAGIGLAELTVLAQLDRSFILATDGRAIVLVDQHAAHERIAYEKIAGDAALHAVRQPLLMPDFVELDRDQAIKLDESLEALRAAGVEIDPFGERSYRVTAMPAVLAGRHFDVRGYLDDLDDDTPGLDAREHVWATMACHSVVRAGERMELAEMQAVISRLVHCKNPMHCPHGRPTIVRLEALQIAKLFKRV